MRRRRLAVLALVAGLLAAGCRVQAEVAVEVQEEGTGTVTVTVTLDEAAAERIPDLDAQLEVDDLTAAGWTVAGPEPADDGGRGVTASKPFGSPEQLAAVLGELAGPDGAFASLELVRSHERAETEWQLTGEVDATAGVVGFSDDELAELLGGEPLGYDLEALAEELGQPVDELVAWQLRADFVEADTIDVAAPGEGEVADDGVGATATWSGTFADEEPVAVAAVASRVDTTTRVLAAVAAAAAVLLLVLLVVRLLLRRRRRRRARQAEQEVEAGESPPPAEAGEDA